MSENNWWKTTPSSEESTETEAANNVQTTSWHPTNGDITTQSSTQPSTAKRRAFYMTTFSTTNSEIHSSSNALTNPGATSNADSTPDVKLFIALPVTLIAVALVIIIWLFLKKINRSKERRNQPDAEEKVGKPKDLKGKDGNIDVEYHHAVKPSNYYTEVDKEPKSTSKGADSKGKASPGQYEEIDKISPADQPKSMTSSNHGDNQGYEETSQHKTPFYYTLEPPDNGVSNDGEVTSHQNLGYDQLDRGRDPNNIGTGNNPGYAKLDHTPRGVNDYDRLKRDGAIEKPSQDNEISTNEYSQLDIQVSSASASYDKLNHERKNTGK